MNNKSVFVLFLQLIQSLLTALTVIILANLLSTNDYGKYVATITFASVLPLFAGLGGEHVFLMHASRESKMIPILFGNAFFIRGVLTVLSSLVAALLLFFLNIEHALAILYIIIGALLSVFANPFFLSFYRVKGLHVRPWVMCFFSPFSLLLFLLLLPKSYLTFNWVSFGYLMSNLLTFLIFLVDMHKRVKMKFSWTYTRKYFKTGMMFSVSQAFDYAFSRMDIFVIQFFLGTNWVAVYAAGQKVVSLFQLIPSSFHVVELPEFHRAASVKVLLVEKFRNLRKVMFELSFLLFGLLILNAKYIVDILYNDEYARSYSIVIILSLANILFFVNYPYYMLGEAINKIKERMNSRIAAFFCTIIFLSTLLHFFGINGAAMGLFLGQLLFSILLHIITRNYNAGIVGLISDSKSVIIAIFSMVVAYYIGSLFEVSFVKFLVQSITYSLLYIFVGGWLGFLDVSYLVGVFAKIFPGRQLPTSLTKNIGDNVEGYNEIQGNKLSRDIVFLITGKPLPAMLDMGRAAKNEGQNVLMVLLERGEEALTIDSALINFDVVTIHVEYKGVDLRRITSFPKTYYQLKQIILEQLKPGGIIVTSSYDLLLFGRMIAAAGDYKIRHQVRDLHSLQLSGSITSSMFVTVEKYLLRKVESIIVSSPEFVTQYYSKIYQGKSILLENTPDKNTWHDFVKENDLEKVFTIGFVGIIRYQKSLYQLIDAVHRLNTEGYKIKVLFAGGGDVTDLKERITNHDLFEFLGPYEYTRDIKRLYSSLDLIYAVYDSYDRNCQLAMPNKFYESIIAKIPIIVAKNTFVEREVKRVGIGTSVLSEDVEGLVELLRIALRYEGWYREAMENLEKADADVYYKTYDNAMKASILS